MFLERKIQNLFFLIFIIILVRVTPLYLVKAKVLKISQKIPSFTKTMNSKSNNTKLHLPDQIILNYTRSDSPAKLTFDISDLDDIEKTKEERKYFYKLTFEDKDLLEELDKKQKTLEDKLFVCHLNTSIFDSDNNPLTDLFDIKCSYRKSGTNDSFNEFKNLSKPLTFYKIDMDKKILERQTRDFSFFKIDLKEWKYDIQIEIKTKKLYQETYENEKLYSERCDELLEKYKKLENKEIRLKCELDITDEDNYPVYLFENISKTNCDFEFISSSDLKILSNPIWLVFKKNNEFLIWDRIINQEVKYQEVKYKEYKEYKEYKKYKKYQDLMDYLYHSSWKKRIENKFDDEFDRNLISLKSIVDENEKKNSEITETISSLNEDISTKEKELNNLKSQFKRQNNSEITKTILSLNEDISTKEKELNNLQSQLKEKNNSKTISSKKKELKNLKSQLKEKNNSEITKTILSLNEDISTKEKELNNLQSQLKENILNQEKTKEEYESSNTKYLEECKKKEVKIKQEFDSNNVSRIKLYFLKEIYDINNSDTHSSVHVKCDWDIGEIKYDGGASNKRFNNFLSEQLKKWQDQGESIKIEPSKIKETCDRLNNLLKEKLSNKEYHEMMDNLNKENWNIVENTVGKKLAEYLKNNYTSVGNKEILRNIKKEELEQIDKTNVENKEILRDRKIKELEQINKTKKDYMEKKQMKKKQIRINKDYIKKTKENAIAMFSSQSQFVTPQIRNEDETICYATNT